VQSHVRFGVFFRKSPKAAGRQSVKQIAYRNKAVIIILQVTHCTTADNLVIPNFSPAGSVLSKKHGFATFVHKQLEWSLDNQSPEQSETEWLHVQRRHRI